MIEHERDGDGASVAALEQLYRSRYRRFLRLALAYVGSREAAADLVQEAFARALRSRHAFRGDAPLETWVWQIVLNAARDQRRRPVSASLLPDIDLEMAATNGSPHAQAWPELRTAIAALADRQREVLFLRHYADLREQEIGEVLGIARGTVAATLHAAHTALRAKLERVER